MERVDVVVVGMGPGGEEAAGRLAEAGLDVVGIDRRLLGGECPYYGCIPSKMMVRAADVLAEGRRIPELAGNSRISPDWAPVAARIRNEATDDWDDKAAVERFESKGGRFVRAQGRLTSATTVAVDGQEFEATRGIVLNIGTDPAVPPIPGLAGTPLWTNREALAATTVPASLLVLGGGTVGCELAQVFARFGASVTVVEAGGQLLPSEEPPAAAVLAEVFRREGIEVLLDAHVAGAEHDANGFSLSLDDGRTLRAEQLLVATGRHVDLAGAGLDTIGVDLSGRFVSVDSRLRLRPGVWAIGDMTGEGAFTHVSMYQAEIVVADILDQPGVPAADYRAVPRVTFTDPEIASVGMTQAQAAQAGLDVLVGKAELAATSRGWIHGPGNDGFIRVVADAGRRIVVGATVVGPYAGEVMSALAVAAHAEVPVDRLLHMIYAFPTFHRGVLDALRDLRRPG